MSSRLTVNLGLRYELWSPIDEQFGRQANFDLQNMTLYIPKGPNQDAPLPPNFAAAFPTVKVSRGQVPSTLIPWDKYDFGPRVGTAYRIGDKTVVRVGFGMFYGGEENQGGSPNRGEGVPFNETVNLTRANGVSSFIGVSPAAVRELQLLPERSHRRVPDQRVHTARAGFVPRRAIGFPKSAGAEVEFRGAARVAGFDVPGSGV